MKLNLQAPCITLLFTSLIHLMVDKYINHDVHKYEINVLCCDICAVSVLRPKLTSHAVTVKHEIVDDI